MNNNFYTYCYFGNMPGLSRIVKEADFDINERNSSGQTGLEIACGSRRVDAVKFLLLNGADPTLKNEEGASVVDKMNEYDESIQSLLHLYTNGEFKDEISHSKAENSKAILITKKIKAKVEQERGLRKGLSKEEVDDHNEKIQRIINFVEGRLTEDQVVDLVAGEMVSCFLPLLLIRADAEQETGVRVQEKIGRKYHELAVFNEFCKDLTDTILKMDIDEELLDDLIDVVNIRSRLFYLESDTDTINILVKNLADLMGDEIAKIIASGELEEKPHRE